MDACWVGDQRVAPQPGRFYGGWITPTLVLVPVPVLYSLIDDTARWFKRHYT